MAEVRNRPTPPKPTQVSGPPPRRRRNNRRMLASLIVLLLIVGLVYFAYKYHQEQNKVNKLSDPKTASAVQTTDLVNRVGKLVELPTGQSPTIATVTDISKLQGQAFFANAQNGDKVLIYTQAKKAVLYRPSSNKVIEIAPLNIGSNQAAQNPAGTNTSN